MASVLLLLPEVNMLVAGLLVVVLHRHRWNHLADLQRSSVIGRGGRERERAMDRENVSGDARGLEADIKDWKAAGLVGGGWQCKHMYKIGSRQIWWQRRAYLLLATRLVQNRQPVA